MSYKLGDKVWFLYQGESNILAYAEVVQVVPNRLIVKMSHDGYTDGYMLSKDEVHQTREQLVDSLVQGFKSVLKTTLRASTFQIAIDKINEIDNWPTIDFTSGGTR